MTEVPHQQNQTSDAAKAEPTSITFSPQLSADFQQRLERARNKTQSTMSPTPETAGNDNTFPEPNLRNAIDQNHEKFTWELCTPDPDNKDNILVWRRISQVSPEDALNYGALSSRASRDVRSGQIQNNREDFISSFGDQDIQEIATRYIQLSGQRHDEPSPVLHTTFLPENAQSIPYQGVVVEYSVPKQWILDHENEILVTTGFEGGEKELGFFYGLPQKTIKTISYKDDQGTKVVETADQIKAKAEPPTTPDPSTRQDISTFRF